MHDDLVEAFRDLKRVREQTQSTLALLADSPDGGDVQVNLSMVHLMPVLRLLDLRLTVTEKMVETILSGRFVRE